jgi:hypothetical protein
MYDTTREAENTTDRKELVETVDGKLDHVWEALREAIDVTVTKENSNTSEAPAPMLSSTARPFSKTSRDRAACARKAPVHLKGLYQAIPTLDPAYSWEPDTDAELPGTMKTEVRAGRSQDREGQRRAGPYEATDKHPAQVKEVSRSTRTSPRLRPSASRAWSARPPRRLDAPDFRPWQRR